MKFNDFLTLDESINDKGIMKAIFITGLPGAGKSYTASSLKGTISPRIVNSDIALEYLSSKTGIPATTENWRPYFSDDTKRITSASLFNYINGVLPLFIDGTSNDTSNILARTGILESIGYDVGMIYIDVDVDVAKRRVAERAKKINRTVDESFIDKIYKDSDKHKKYLESKFNFFKVYKSNDELDDSALNKLFKQTYSFYNSELINPIGTAVIEKMKSNSEKYLTPNIMSTAVLKKKLDNWYKS